MQKPTVAVINHGCKLNQFEGESIAYSLERAGFDIVWRGARGAHPGGHGDQEDGSLQDRVVQNDPLKPDIIIVNTCTVTGKSDRKSRHSVLQAARRLAGEGTLIVTGCYAETNPDDLRKIDGVDLVIGHKNKALIPDILREKYGKPASHAQHGACVFNFHDPAPHRSRAFVKVQDGCDMRCSYCKVPYARGASQSRSDHDVIDAVREIVANGYHEVVLTGVDLGSYNYDGTRIDTLISRIFEKVSGNYRIRLSSIEPVYFADTLIELIAQCPNIVPHFHIPLQSGSDRLLRLMRRPYTSDIFLDIIGKLRSARPESHIAVDVIVGFPTEMVDDFRATERVIRDCECASLHVFRYSAREGTRAALLADDISYPEKSMRSRRLIELGGELNYIYRKRFLGTVRDTIIHQRGKRCEGITDNYIRVRLPSNDEMQKERCSVRIVRVDEKHTYGEIIL